MRIKEPTPKWYEFYRTGFCELIRFWSLPKLIDGADGWTWRALNPEDYDRISRTHRAYARIHSGAFCITGLNFWQALEPFRITSKAGNVDPWHHGCEWEDHDGHPAFDNPIFKNFWRLPQPLGHKSDVPEV